MTSEWEEIGRKLAEASRQIGLALSDVAKKLERAMNALQRAHEDAVRSVAQRHKFYRQPRDHVYKRHDRHINHARRNPCVPRRIN